MGVDKTYTKKQLLMKSIDELQLILNSVSDQDSMVDIGFLNSLNNKIKGDNNMKNEPSTFISQLGKIDLEYVYSDLKTWDNKGKLNQGLAYDLWIANGGSDYNTVFKLTDFYEQVRNEMIKRYIQSQGE